MLTRIKSLFPLWALLLSALAYISPEKLVGAKPMIVPLRGIAMIGIGMPLTWHNFTGVLRRPAAVGLGVALSSIWFSPDRCLRLSGPGARLPNGRARYPSPETL